MCSTRPYSGPSRPPSPASRLRHPPCLSHDRGGQFGDGHGQHLCRHSARLRRSRGRFCTGLAAASRVLVTVRPAHRCLSAGLGPRPHDRAPPAGAADARGREYLYLCNGPPFCPHVLATAAAAAGLCPDRRRRAGHPVAVRVRRDHRLWQARVFVPCCARLGAAYPDRAVPAFSGDLCAGPRRRAVRAGHLARRDDPARRHRGRHRQHPVFRPRADPRAYCRRIAILVRPLVQQPDRRLYRPPAHAPRRAATDCKGCRVRNLRLRVLAADEHHGHQPDQPCRHRRRGRRWPWLWPAEDRVQLYLWRDFAARRTGDRRRLRRT